MKVYNTLRKQKEDFIPVEPGKVKIYVCGPTTYNYIHLGNARPIVVFDVIRRYFRFRGYAVTFVQNFTDVDDKIINRAKEEHLDTLALSRKYIEAYFEDADQLNVLRADAHPKVSEHMEDIIAMVRCIIEHDLAYDVNGDVYYAVRQFKGYGKLSGRSIDELQAGARIAVGEQKKDPLDFALWKAAKPGEPSWDSPWGKGRPGWHIECSAMSTKYLGKTFDIHGGGADLVFPHHENEIAQSEGCNCVQSVNYWLHNGFITINQEKMSKSLGNFFLVRDILAKYSGPVVRFYLLNTHYRSPLDFDDQKLTAAEKSLHRIWNAYHLIEEKLAAIETAPADEGTGLKTLQHLPEKTKAAFIAAMDDDFNTSLALAAIFDLCKEVNSLLNARDFRGGAATAAALRKILTLFSELDEVCAVLIPPTDETDDLTEDLLQIIIDLRSKARAAKDWAAADYIRDALKPLGIVIEDTAQGPRWKKEKKD